MNNSNAVSVSHLTVPGSTSFINEFQEHSGSCSPYSYTMVLAPLKSQL